MKRIIIIGTSGCGKTTLAKNLSNVLNTPCIDLDEHYWLLGWKKRDSKEFQQIIDQLTKKKNWIISGNYSNIINLTWKRCDTIIWLDYSLTRCLYQGFFRSIKRILFHEPCCNGNYESMKSFFSKDSILFWIVNTFNRRKLIYAEAFENKIEGKSYYRFINCKIMTLK
jgi:adenylate kinase family enzyme